MQHASLDILSGLPLNPAATKMPYSRHAIGMARISPRSQCSLFRVGIIKARRHSPRFVIDGAIESFRSGCGAHPAFRKARTRWRLANVVFEGDNAMAAAAQAGSAPTAPLWSDAKPRAGAIAE